MPLENWDYVKKMGLIFTCTSLQFASASLAQSTVLT